MAGGFGRMLGGATPGLGRLAMALGNGGAAQQQAFDQELGAQTKIAQALAQIRASDAGAAAHEAAARASGAQAALHGAEADALGRRAGIADQVMAAQAGVDVPTFGAWRQGLQTGSVGQVPMGPPADDGGMGLGRAQIAPEVSSKIGQVFGRLAPVLANVKDIKPDDYAKMLGAYRTMDLGDQVLGGQRTAADVGRAQAAVEAKPLFHADASGGVLDLFGGGLAVDNPLAQGTITLRREQAGAQKANAAQSYAAADSSRASAALHRAQAAEVGNGANRAGAKPPAGYRWLPDGQTLEAIPGGPADPNTKGAKLAKPPTEGQAKALMFGSRMAAADEVLAEMADAGVKMPGGIKATAEVVAGAVPLIGEALSAGAGAATNWTQSARQQQVEQAQRDFINAVLRRESGAAIGSQEFANATRQYFPQAGDSDQVLRQKAANRKTAIAGFKAEFGDAMAPEFDRIVSESRAVRHGGPAKSQPAAKTQKGGATGSWGDDWIIKRVN